MKALPTALTDAAGAELGGKLYLAGGKTSSTERIDDFRSYDPATDQWSVLADMPGPGREDVSLVASGGFLYVFGGAASDPFEGDQVKAARFDPGSGSWQDGAVTEMPSGRSGMAAVDFDGRIWLIGGFDATGTSSDTVLLYNPATDSYSAGPSLPTPRDHAAAVVHDGAVYLFGGRDRGHGPMSEPMSVLRINSRTGSWTTVGDPMPRPRRAFVATSADGRIRLFGGESFGSATVDEVDSFNPANGQWSTPGTMPTARHGLAGDSVGTATYLAGGSLSAGSSNLTNVTDRFVP